MNEKLMRCDIEFIHNIEKVYPEMSFRKATKELNKVLDELLYGIK